MFGFTIADVCVQEVYECSFHTVLSTKSRNSVCKRLQTLFLDFVLRITVEGAFINFLNANICNGKTKHQMLNKFHVHVLFLAVF